MRTTMSTKFSDSSVLSVFPIPLPDSEPGPAAPPAGMTDLYQHQHRLIRLGWIVLALTVVIFLGYIGFGRIEGAVIPPVRSRSI
jgi:hypothetical protein